MTGLPGPPEDWDRLREALPPDLAPPAPPPATGDAEPGRLLLLAGALGDLLSVVAVNVCVLLALRLLGHPTVPSVLPWVGALSLIWWSLTAAALVVVRRGTPGMLVAGYGFTLPVPHGRVAGVLLLGLTLGLTLGLAGPLGLSRPLLHWAGGSRLALFDPE